MDAVTAEIICYKKLVLANNNIVYLTTIYIILLTCTAF